MATKDAKKKNPFFTPTGILSVLVIALALNLLMNAFKPDAPPPAQEVVLEGPGKIALGKRVDVTIVNRTDTPLALSDACPAEPLTVERREGDAWVPVTAEAPGTVCPTLPTEVAPGEKHTVRYSSWNTALFDRQGRFRITLEETGATTEFEIVERSWYAAIGVAVLYQPLYNALIWLISFLPGMSLALGIIALTLLVRLILFIPTYRSLAHQAELQELQPELERIKKQHAADKEKQAQATMQLYKEKGVNPCGSCLPLLVQLPVLWAMYFVLLDGVDAANRVLLYPALQGVDMDAISATLAGINLLEPRNLPIALIGFALQFLSMKLIAWTLPPEVRAAQKGTPAGTTNLIMTYVLPVFIGYLSFIYPAGLGLYWATSTLFGIGQQLVLKRARERQAEARATKKAGGPIKDAEFRDPS